MFARCSLRPSLLLKSKSISEDCLTRISRAENVSPGGQKHFSRTLLPRCGMRASPAGGKEGTHPSRNPALSHSATRARVAGGDGLGPARFNAVHLRETRHP